MFTYVSLRANSVAPSRCSRVHSVCCRSSVVLLLLCVTGGADAGTYQTENFRVCAPDRVLARQIAERAEELRSALAIEWLGGELGRWSSRCEVAVDPDSERLMGDTTYIISRGEVTHWRMELRGEPHRILEILLPHEVVHTVLASHFRAAIPRWADEGAALTAEDEAERERLWRLEGHRLAAGKREPLRAFLSAKEYPSAREKVRNFYVQGGSLTEFLLLAGKRRFVEFVAAGMSDGWDLAVAEYYGFADVNELEAAWQNWIRNDRPIVQLGPSQLLVAGVTSAGRNVEASEDSGADSRLAVHPFRISAGAGGQ